MVIKILKNEKKYSLPTGNVNLYDLDCWIESFPTGKRFPWDAWNLLHLEYISKNPWLAAQRIGIQVRPLMEDIAYKCPIMDTIYTACAPYAVITKATSQLQHYAKYASPWQEIILDQEWIRTQVVRWKCSIWHALAMGSGYNTTILPSDGSNSKELNCVRLDNGDRLLVWHFVWHNK